MKIHCPHCKNDPTPLDGWHRKTGGVVACRVFDVTGKFWKMTFDERRFETLVVAVNTNNGFRKHVATIRPAGFVRVMLNYHALRFTTQFIDPLFKLNPNHLSEITAHVIKMENRTKVNVTNLRADETQKKGWKANERKKNQKG